MMSITEVPNRNIRRNGPNGRKRLYRLRAEKAIGRALKRHEDVHHHSAEQLVICDSHSYHGLLHARTRIVRAGGNPDTHAICGRCKRLLGRVEFSPNRANPTGRNPMCKECERNRKALV